MTTDLSPRRQQLAERVLSRLAPWPDTIDPEALAEAASCDRHDALAALDDLWANGDITMRMLGDTLIVGPKREAQL